MAEGFLGATASSAGDDFHELWSLQQLLEILKPQAAITSVLIEGVPADERHALLGEKAQAVDVTVERRVDGQTSFHYAQLKYSPSQPALSWSWSRLLASKVERKPDHGVLGKLAQMMKAVAFAGSYSIVTNQPLAKDVADDVARLIENGETQSADDRDLLERLQRGTGLDEAELIAFLGLWDLSGFGSVSRLAVETGILRQLAQMIDADARSDMMVMQQRAADLVLPENRNFGPVTKDTLLVWLGAGANEILKPAPSRINPVEPFLKRAQTTELVRKIVTGDGKPLRICADGGCGKTSLVLNLPRELPAGSEMIVYDCYGGGLFLAADDCRHLPAKAFTQVGNELAFLLGTPFVIQKVNSARPLDAFCRRVDAAARLLATRSSEALLVLCFDAADNSRIGAERRKEACFLDDLLGVSRWPDNVRIVLTCRNSRADDVGDRNLFETFQLPPFDQEEVHALLVLNGLPWAQDIAVELHDLSGGIPRRLAYAIEGLDGADADKAIARLMPRGVGIDPLFEKRAQEAGIRLGDEKAIWALLCILARCPRPIPATILERLAGLPAGGLRDVSADLGGIVEHAAGWSFHDEDFEHFADGRTSSIAAQLLEKVADTLFSLRTTNRYAATALGEVLAATNRLEQLYELVRSPDQKLDVLSRTEQWLVHAKRLSLGIRCCLQETDVSGACDLLIGSAEASVRDTLFARLILENLDLAVLLEPEVTSGLVLIDRTHRKYRARCRIELAAALARDEPAKAREHLRWWHEEQRGAPDGKNEQIIQSGDVASEFLAELALSDFDHAAGGFGRWSPVDAKREALRRILAKGNFSAAELETFLAHRSWPPEVLAPVLAAAILSGAIVTDPPIAKAIHDLGRMKRTRWPHRKDFDILRSGLFVSQEAALLICEIALAHPALHPAIAGILESGLALPVIEKTDYWDELRAGGAQYMRVLALRTALEEPERELESWLPGERREPPEQDCGPASQSSRPLPQKVKDAEWNRDRAAAILALRPLWLAARKLATLTVAEDRRTLIQDLVKVLQPPAFERHVASTDQRFILIRSVLLTASCHGMPVAPLVEQAWPLLKERFDSSIEILLDLSGWLVLRPANADLVAERLVELERQIWAFSAKGSTTAGLLMRCARIALRSDRDLARHFFDSAVVAIERVDFEAMSELELAIAVAHQGIEGSRADKAAIATDLGNLAGALDESLGLRHDLPYPRLAGGIAALDLGTGLRAMSHWHDRRIASPDYTLCEILETGPSLALSPAQRIALCIACDMLDRPSLELARTQAALPPEVSEWLMDYGMTVGDSSLSIAEYQRAGQSVRGGVTGLATDGLKISLDAWCAPDSVTAEEPPAPGIDNRQDLDEALEALQAQPVLRRRRAAETLLLGLKGPTLRVPALDALRSNDEDAGYLLDLLPRIVPQWSPYPPVTTWIKRVVPELVVEHIAALRGFEGRHSTLERALGLLDLSAQEGAALVLRAIVHNAQELDPAQILSLTSVVAAGERPERRNALLRSLMKRVAAKTTHPAMFDLAEADPAEGEHHGLAALLFAMLGDPEKAVRWRASHAVRLLASCGDPVLGALVDQLDNSAAPSYVIAPFYSFSAQYQLLLTLERCGQDRPERIAPYAQAIMRHLRSSTHLLAREHGRGLLLYLQEARAISLDPEDVDFLRALNRPATVVSAGGAQVRQRDRHYRDPKKRRFHFDETDTIPYWYADPASFLDMDMGDFLDAVETVICDTWGFTSTLDDWLGEPRLDRFREHGNARSNRHGAQPRVEDLHRYLEWHGMLCAVGALIETRPVHKTSGYPDTFVQWLAGLRPTVAPHWLSDLRSAPPMEPRFWGLGHPGTDVRDVDGDALPGWMFDRELEGEAGITVAAGYTLHGDDENLSVDIRSALVTSETAFALAHALTSARDHMDFILPGGDSDHTIREQGFELLPWLRFHHLDAGIDRADPFRGAASGVPVEPFRLPGQAPLQGDPTRMLWMQEDGNVVLRSSWWGDEDAGQSGHGWRTTASREFLERLTRDQRMSMIFGVELRAQADTRKYKKQWRMFVMNADGAIVRVDRQKGHLGPILVRKSGLVRTNDTFGRWLLHRIAELEAGKTAAHDAAVQINKDILALCDRFRTHRAGRRW